MKTIIKIFCVLFCLVIINGCENSDFEYRDVPRIRMEGPYKWAVGTDSLLFSFITSPWDITEMKMDVTLLIMGEVAQIPRKINIRMVEDKTTASSELYSFPTVVELPAGHVRTNLPVILKRNDILKEKTISLWIEVVDSEDFVPGITERNHLLLKWNEMLSKPSNWDKLIEYFGAYSTEKYRFILNTLGVSEIDDSKSVALLENYVMILVAAVNEYNKQHPGEPLVDENGQPIIF